MALLVARRVCVVWSWLLSAHEFGGGEDSKPQALGLWWNRQLPAVWLPNMLCTFIDSLNRRLCMAPAVARLCGSSLCPCSCVVFVSALEIIVRR